MNAYQQAKRALEQANPTGWRWPDKDGNSHDGPELIGEYVADDRSERHGVDIAVIRTEDGRHRSLFFWQPNDGEEEREYHLNPRWAAADPQVGDFVAIQQDKRESMANPGQKYNYFTVSVTRAADLEGAESPEPVAAAAPADTDDIPF